MSSEDLLRDSLRDQLRHEADLVTLPARDPAVAVARARRRQRNRRTALGVAAVAAVVAGVVPVVVGGDDGTDRTVSSSNAGRLPRTGPLAFDWQAADGGLALVSSSFQTDDGTVYALSTAPGFTGVGTDEWKRALYRLGDDGTWEPIDLDGDRPRAMDVSSDGGALYAISTAPGASDDATVPRLSASTDGGETWAGEDLPPVDPPSDQVTWHQDRYLSIETAGDTTLAMVTTQFRLDVPASFPEYADFTDVAMGPDGLVLTAYPPPTTVDAPGAAVFTPDADALEAWGQQRRAEAVTPPATAAPPTTTEPAPEWSTTTTAAAPDAPAPTTPDTPSAPTAPPETRTLTWAELGLSGPDDLAPTHQLVRHTGSGWEALDGVTGLTGEGLTLAAAGDRFVADGSDGTIVVSDDGTSWTPVPPPPSDSPGFHQVTTVGPALLAASPGQSQVAVSDDLGATWQPVDLTAAGVPAGSFVQSVSSGPLGAAIVLTGPDGWDPLLVVSGDLVDWTATPVADIVGADTNTTVEATVGADRIVVTATLPPATPDGPSAGRTAVGTLVRTG